MADFLNLNTFGQSAELMPAINYVPQAADNSATYGNQLIDLFKFGVGAYYDNRASQFETKTRYEALNGQLFENGQSANALLPTVTMNMMPYILIGGAVLLAVVLMRN